MRRSDVDEWPLRPVVDDVVAAERDRLEADGWSVTVANNVPGTVAVELTHPLVPGGVGAAVTRNESADKARHFLRNFFATQYQIHVVHDAPVRPRVQLLVGKLRGAAGWPLGHEATEAIRSVGYSLAEEGILTMAEAEWLDETLATDEENDPPPRGTE